MSNKNVTTEINLRERDANRWRRVAMADMVAQRMAQSLSRSFVPKNLQQQLKVSIVTCSEGSTVGRMWAAPCGMGWAKLHVEWYLTSADDDGSSKPKRHIEQLSRSGYCGILDMYNANYGEEVVTIDLCDEIAMVIASKANPRRFNGNY